MMTMLKEHVDAMTRSEGAVYEAIKELETDCTILEEHLRECHAESEHEMHEVEVEEEERDLQVAVAELVCNIAKTLKIHVEMSAHYMHGKQ